MKTVVPVLEAHRSTIRIVVATTVLGIFSYALFAGQLLLGMVASAIVVTTYKPITDGKYSHVPPILLGWIGGVYAFLSSQQLVLSGTFGLTVYVALVLYRSVE